MANIIFPAKTVGLIVLSLMLFHHMQLLVCAALTRQYARQVDEAAPVVPVQA